MKKEKDFITSIDSDENHEFFTKVHDYYYAHGQLELDLGYDVLLFNKKKYGELPSFEGIYHFKHGRKKCTLFSWKSNSPMPESRKGLMVYDSDKAAYKDALKKYKDKLGFV